MNTGRNKGGEYVTRRNLNHIKIKPQEIKINSDEILKINPRSNSMSKKAISRIVSIEEKNHLIDEKHRKISNTWKYDNYTYIDPVFLGDTIYIVGGGSSLKDFDFNQLQNKIVIAINKAFLYIPFAQVLYWSDTRFFEWYEKEIEQFKGIKVTCRPEPKRANIINLLNTGKNGLETMSYGIRDGGNSGYAAINLAYHLGAKTIILLGFDMYTNGKETHWHDGYTSTANTDVMSKLMIPNFDTLVSPLEKRKVKIYNASLNSKLECFPKITIENALSFE